YTPPPSYTALRNYAPPQNSAPPISPAPQNPIIAPSSNTAPSLQDRYATAMHLYNENAFEPAMSAFHDLQRDDPNGTYASNYIYWQGESYYALNRYNEA